METKDAGGASIPTLGYGTYGLYGEECAQAVRDALEMGYRHLDTAELYDNHRGVGRGIAESAVHRDAVFLTTKVWKTNLEPDRVRTMVQDAVAALGVEYIDLLLIHSPNESVPLEDTIRAMNELQHEGVIHHIGVSNFSIDQVTAAMNASQTPIVTNQIEYHHRIRRDEHLAFAAEHDLLITAYSPLNKGRGLDDPVLDDIGRRYGKTPAQVVLRWLLQQPRVIPIPKAADRTHRFENLHVFDFSLTEEEMRTIAEIA